MGSLSTSVICCAVPLCPYCSLSLSLSLSLSFRSYLVHVSLLLSVSPCPVSVPVCLSGLALSVCLYLCLCLRLCLCVPVSRSFYLCVSLSLSLALSPLLVVHFFVGLYGTLRSGDEPAMIHAQGRSSREGLEYCSKGFLQKKPQNRFNLPHMCAPNGLAASL